jgi:hypothetical protein
VIGTTITQHLDATKDITNAFNEAARHAKNLHRSITLMTPPQRRELDVAGCVTSFQLEHLADVLAQDALNLKEWSRNSIRTGGRNPAAYAVASGVRRLFRRMRRPNTFGRNTDGGPSTYFGRTVQFTIGAFGVKVDWQGPTKKGREKQEEVNERFIRIKGSRPETS